MKKNLLKPIMLVLSIAALTVISTMQAFASSSSADTSFDTWLPVWFNWATQTTLSQSDGKMIVWGSFTQYKWITVNHIVRLNTDGSVDPYFTVGNGFDGEVVKIIQQTDGKILVGGSFSHYNWITTKTVARLNPDGSLDTGFNVGNGTQYRTLTLALQSDGKIIVWGEFAYFESDALPRTDLVRLNTDGSLDTSFNAWNWFSFSGEYMQSSFVDSVTIQNDGKILVAWLFTSYNWSSVYNFIRLNADGSIDTNFVFDAITAWSNWWISSVAIQNDGKILIGWRISIWWTTYWVGRLNTDGSIDSNFISTNVWDVRSVVVQNDGKIIVAWSNAWHIFRLNTDWSIDATANIGSWFRDWWIYSMELIDNQIIICWWFTSYQGIDVKNIIRLNSDLSVDLSFNLWNSLNSAIYTMALQNDGKVIVGWPFNSYKWSKVHRILRINTNGSLDTGFIIDSGEFLDLQWSFYVSDIKIQSDGKVLFLGWFANSWWKNKRIVRLNTDGSVDSSFNTNNILWESYAMRSMAIQQDGKILISWGWGHNLIRLNSDWSQDNSFDADSRLWQAININTIIIQDDGKILVEGSLPGSLPGKVIRLNTDGSIDTWFNIGNGFDLYWSPEGMVKQDDGKLIIFWGFSSFNDISTRIIRLNTDGSLDTGFTTNISTILWAGGSKYPNALALQADGKMIVGWGNSFFVRINSDGTIDTWFDGGSGVDSLWAIRTIVIQSWGKIFIGWDFSSYNNYPAWNLVSIYGDSSSVVELPNSLNSVDVANVFKAQWYVETNGILMWSTPISLSLTNWLIPIDLSLSNQNLTIDLTSNTQLKQKDNTSNYNWIVSVPLNTTINSVNDKIVATAFKIGSADSIKLVGGIANISLPANGMNIWDPVQVFYSQDHWVTWYTQTITNVINKNWQPYISFSTTHFTEFAVAAISGSFSATLKINNNIPSTTSQTVLLGFTTNPYPLKMRFSNNNTTRSDWENYSSSKVRKINRIEWVNTVYAQFDFDWDGNSDINTNATITYIKDTVPPVITLLGNSSVNIIQGATYTDAGATALDNLDGNISANIITSGTINTSILWTYQITYNVTDSDWNTATQVTRYVTVNTKDAPTANVSYSTTETISGDVTAIVGNFSEAVTWLNESSHTFTENGVFTFTFQDLYGNTGSAIANVFWIDRTYHAPNSGGGASWGSPWIAIIGDSYIPPKIWKLTIWVPKFNNLTWTSYSIDRQTASITKSPYTPEINSWYLWAYQYGITTMSTIQQANIEGKLTRKDMAKMISSFALNVLNKEASTGDNCLFSDIDTLSREAQSYIIVSCKLGLMGYDSNGKTVKKIFNPLAEVDRAQFGTILSRLLRGNLNNQTGTAYYQKHLEALKVNGIMTKTSNPTMKELRWNVFLMLQRTVK